MRGSAMGHTREELNTITNIMMGGCVVLGAGFGLAFGNFVVGVLLGVGVGLLAMAAVRFWVK